MPYNSPPARIKNLSAAAQKIWVAAYNSAYDQGNDEASCNAIAYAAVKKAGYATTRQARANFTRILFLVNLENDPEDDPPLMEESRYVKTILETRLPTELVFIRTPRDIEIALAKYDPRDTFIYNWAENLPGWIEGGETATAMVDDDWAHTASAAGVQRLIFDRAQTYLFLREWGIPVPDFLLINSVNDVALWQGNWPCFIGPNNVHGSESLALVHSPEEAAKQIEIMRQKHQPPWLYREYIGSEDGTRPAREFSVACLSDGKTIEVLPIAEANLSVLTHDYKSEADKGPGGPTVEELNTCPAEVDAQLKEKLGEWSREIFHNIGVKTYARFDWRMWADESDPYCIDANAEPEVCRQSLMELIGRAAGLTFEQLILKILDDGMAYEKMLEDELPPVESQPAPSDPERAQGAVMPTHTLRVRTTKRRQERIADTAAYQAGFAAGKRAGDSTAPRENPNPPNTVEWTQWAQGWEDGKKAAGTRPAGEDRSANADGMIKQLWGGIVRAFLPFLKDDQKPKAAPVSRALSAERLVEQIQALFEQAEEDAEEGDSMGEQSLAPPARAGVAIDDAARGAMQGDIGAPVPQGSTLLTLRHHGDGGLEPVDIYFEDGGMFVLAVGGGRLYRFGIQVQGDSVVMDQTGVEVTETFPALGTPQARERMSALTVIRQADGRTRWLAIAASSVLNRQGEIDSTKLFDSFVDFAERTGIYPILDVFHQREKLRLGEADFVARDGALYLASGLGDDSDLAKAAFDTLERAGKDWGLSISYLKTREPELLEVDRGIHIPVFNEGINDFISVLPAERACNFFTAIGITREVSKVRMKEDVYNALVALVGAERAKAFAAQADDTNRTIDETRLIQRAAQALKERQDAAKAQGAAAAKGAANPHPAGSEEHKAWQAGYAGAHRTSAPKTRQDGADGQDVYAEGMAAFQASLTETNPYAAGTPEYAQWHRGFEDAKAGKPAPETRQDTSSKEYAEGVAAAKAGKSENPYPADSDQNHNWQAGYDSAMREYGAEPKPPETQDIMLDEEALRAIAERALAVPQIKQIQETLTAVQATLTTLAATVNTLNTAAAAQTTEREKLEVRLKALEAPEEEKRRQWAADLPKQRVVATIVRPRADTTNKPQTFEQIAQGTLAKMDNQPRFK